ncbi:hypothetical protein ACWD45_26235 [Streptomyces rubiginosohelvolus]
MRGEAGDRDGAEALARQAADLGSPDALMRLGEMRKSTDRDGAEVLGRPPTSAAPMPWTAWP